MLYGLLLLHRELDRSSPSASAVLHTILLRCLAQLMLAGIDAGDGEAVVLAESGGGATLPHPHPPTHSYSHFFVRYIYTSLYVWDALASLYMGWCCMASR